MLKTNFGNYPRGDHTITLVHDLLGHSIFNSEGDHWKDQRKTASFEFNKRSFRNFVVHTVRLEIVDRLLPLMYKYAEAKETLELEGVFERFGFDNICRVAFGVDPGCLSTEVAAEGLEFMRLIGDAQNLIAARFMGVFGFTWKMKKLINIGPEKRLKESIKIVQDFAMDIIKTRKAKLEENQEEEIEEDLLSRFASYKDTTEELLRDNVVGFILAGRETTSSALTWFFWVLSSRPDVENKILGEIKSIRSTYQSPDGTFSFDELREMNYLHAAITESLRLYPPVAIDTQSCRDGDTMPDGTFVGKKWFVKYSAYAMGRMESIWGKDCMEYNPERWLENGVFRPESPFRFPVFHAGPRLCLGKEMAYIQMKSIVAAVIERFEIEPVEKDRIPEPLLCLTMRMKGGLHVRVREREVV
ncbi:uncharacterized protein A4U43_C02F19320 [Asparagus officinalis]|uniref:noroxomaritidine synthase n=2 Tax=Asparagus officinalis TaxID=4686 RepID=A0A5P1FP72_ASPOF|nr:uncharacterized protein A4U43_C02F19320 [Asparagus officinalis]